MKKLFYAFFALGLFSLITVACNDDDDDDYYQLSQGVGDIMSYSGSTMKIRMDDMDTVLITNANADKYGFKVNQRVSFAGEIISERKIKNRFYEFRAYAMDSVLTKKPLLQSDLDANQDLADSVGNDDIELIKANIASKYVNINFFVLQGGNGVKHFINLVVDDVTKPIEIVDGTLVLDASFRQNANNDEKRYEARGFVSFNIEDYLAMKGLNKLKINIKFKANNSTEVIKTVEIDLSETGTTSLEKSNGIDNRIFNNVM